MPSQNMSIWHMDYFELVIFKEQQTQEKLWKLTRNYPFVREIYIYKGNLFVRVFPSLYLEEKDGKISRNSYQWRGPFKHQFKSALQPYLPLLCFVW